MSPKRFKLSAEQVRPLVESFGWCLATDRITVDGCPVGYMYREPPAAGGDSGWRFFSGDESDDYMQNNANHGVYDINTVANYDPAIVPYLGAPVGTHLDRAQDDSFVPTP